jgi:hypothetical protein
MALLDFPSQPSAERLFRRDIVRVELGLAPSETPPFPRKRDPIKERWLDRKHVKSRRAAHLVDSIENQKLDHGMGLVHGPIVRSIGATGPTNIWNPFRLFDSKC